MIFSKSINELNIDDIRIFCEKGIKEGFTLDYKEDFPNNLEKTICAFANTFGGVILLGVEENQEGKPIMPIKGIDFERGLHERVVNIILDNIYPPLFPEIEVVRFQDNGNDKAVVVIRIPQSDMTPHLIDNKRKVYIRTDNRNKPEEVATIDQIEWLYNKRKKSEELKQTLYDNAVKRVKDIYNAPNLWVRDQKFKTSKVQGIFSAIPLFPSRSFTNVKELKKLCSSELKVKDYCWYPDFFPEALDLKTTQYSVLNYHHKENRRGIVFSEFNIYGLFIYQEPLLEQYKDTDIFVVQTYGILAHLDQFIEVVERFYNKIGVWGLIEMGFVINDAFGLNMSTENNFKPSDSFVCHQDTVDIKRILDKRELRDRRLEILKDIFKEICLAFNFDMLDEFIQEYLSENKGYALKREENL